MNAIDIILLAAVFAAVALAARRVLRNKRQGKSSCGCDCGSCGCNCGCGKK